MYDIPFDVCKTDVGAFPSWYGLLKMKVNKNAMAATLIGSNTKASSKKAVMKDTSHSKLLL